MSASYDLRILYVEDDDEIREMLGALLRGEGYDVTLARSAEEGLERLAGETYHLVTTDYHLPDHTGDWLLRTAEAQGTLRGAQSIVVTAALPDLHVGGYRVFRKPLAFDHFLASVEVSLAPARAGQLDRIRHELAAKASGGDGSQQVELALYTSAVSQSSLRALRNMQRLLGRYDLSKVHFQAWDLSREMPSSVDEDRVVFTPTLVKRHPKPMVWIRGDLEDAQMVASLMSQSGVTPRR